MAVGCVEGFGDFEALLVSGGWIDHNQSHDPASPADQVYYRWSQLGVMPALSAQSEPIDSFIVNGPWALDRLTPPPEIISDWLVTPLLSFHAGASAAVFVTTRVSGDFGGVARPDRIELRLCTGEPCLDTGQGVTGSVARARAVGEFTTLLRAVNPKLQQFNSGSGEDGFPFEWSRIALDDLPQTGHGRLAVRYFVDAEELGVQHGIGFRVALDTFEFHEVEGGCVPAAPDEIFEDGFE
jgi:hypothetical protein